ncbi:bifunctional (p)ppGpp synthetase/guanosine-3',5'-bis(diphosphate) 3'-pyrophosphohydrolase [bacterium]|jgi:GTP diphosphokinase / guanosine-3',5'-bis(diphosphate) 3'-diphosphatase|nr:bifunctional (p)ppGpp synthetase/guanosine-3',5'-bis(diphosphate) 3'-pyrophosphohydrolase [bacterium]
MSESPTIDTLINCFGDTMPPEDIQFIRSAYEFADHWHTNQIRKSGKPYITHPLEVGIILAEQNQGRDTIAAALLHDVLEDTNAKESEILSEFGSEVTHLIKGVTKLGKVYFGTSEEAQAENYRRMFLAMAEDLRVVIIKLADRLHNMRTLKHLRPDKQQRIAKETLEIFAPLAYRLGMGSLKWELEDLSMMYLFPEEFKSIRSAVASKREERELYIKKMIKQVEILLDSSPVKGVVTGRPKHFFSIFRKIQKGDDYSEMYDLLGIRIIVDTLANCYETLGIIHAKFTPVAGRIKDYIALPKTNMYQSLHTTVIGHEGRPVEIQIRTKEMDEVAEYGVAAHWKYKEGKKSDATTYQADFAWLRQILSAQQDDPDSYIQTLKIDLFAAEVFVFSPAGELFVLPKGATPIDFAYRVHTEVGNSIQGAKINGHIVTLHYTLQNGDRLEIIQGKTANPKLDWLEFVKTSYAQSKIKQWFRRQDANEKKDRAKHELEKALVAAGYVAKDLANRPNIQPFLDKHQFDSLETLYLAIANGDIGVPGVIRHLDKITGKLDQPSNAEVLQSLDYKTPAQTGKESIYGIRVLGEENIEVYLAKCCHPLPGDDVIGFVTMGFGVAVHRTCCQNISKLSEKDRHRLIDVEWEIKSSERVFPVTLEIEGYDRMGLLKDIVNRISESKTNILQASSKVFSDGRAMIRIQLELKDMDHLNHLKKIVGAVPDVTAVFRPKSG